MDALLRRRIMMMAGSGPTPPVPTNNYLIFGNPVISGDIMTPDSNTNGFVYTNMPFNPGAGHSWVIQTKIKYKTAVAWKDIISSVDGTTAAMKYSITSQTRTNNSNRQYALYVSGNGTSWNILNSECKGTLPLNAWRTFQIVCTYSNGTYTFKQGYIDTGSWTSTYSSSTAPLYGYYIAFGRNMIDAEYDLSETKIWVDGQLWWEAITE